MGFLWNHCNVAYKLYWTDLTSGHEWKHYFYLWWMCEFIWLWWGYSCHICWVGVRSDNRTTAERGRAHHCNPGTNQWRSAGQNWQPEVSLTYEPKCSQTSCKRHFYYGHLFVVDSSYDPNDISSHIHIFLSLWCQDLWMVGVSLWPSYYKMFR